MEKKMVSLRSVIEYIILFLLVLLWAYAAVTKASHWDDFRDQVNSQLLPQALKPWVASFLPPVEIAAAILLLMEGTRLAGMYASAALLLAFSIYAGLIVSGIFPNAPCACGGIVSTMDWDHHFIFNLFFLLLSVFGIYQTNRERRPEKSK